MEITINITDQNIINDLVEISEKKYLYEEDDILNKSDLEKAKIVIDDVISDCVYKHRKNKSRNDIESVSLS